MQGKDIYFQTEVGPRWIQIDLDAIVQNVSQIRSVLRPGCRLMAVVKADAYGCGAVEVSRAVIAAGADMLGVTTVDEGLELRYKGVEAPILIFAPLFAGETAIAAGYDLIGTVDTLEMLDIYAALGKPAKIHLKVNTGMNRFGMDPDQVVEFINRARLIPGLEVEGLYTHLATSAATNKRFMDKQFAVFSRVVKLLEEHEYNIPIKHVCNSIAFLEMPHMHLDMVRIGNLLYGQYPFGYKGSIVIKDPWEAHARILHVREVMPGEAVGYGCDYRASKKTRVGIIPVGFADGLDIAPQFKPKSLTDLFRMLAKTILGFFGKRIGTPLVSKGGKSLQVLGRIGMQVTAVDLSEIKSVQPGDVVQVFMRRTTANSRISRVFKLGGELESVRTPSEHRYFRKESLSSLSEAARGVDQ